MKRYTHDDYMEFMADALSNDPSLRDDTAHRTKTTQDHDPVNMCDWTPMSEILALCGQLTEEEDYMVTTDKYRRQAD